MADQLHLRSGQPCPWSVLHKLVPTLPLFLNEEFGPVLKDELLGDSGKRVISVTNQNSLNT
ncbi:hypothetical protein CY34DRAFT_803601 [Suillus luteus UH-Slu-Lm8-n1]|uniref:Uncharacterized protein n=1 Tax=Suillus luteus UH-Slu-Lm8-n1 TaxID=930992 RepID=A0A0D0B0R8_9AGAM|nr:hypothetical protein CY34DRAFT_803601 [Suillus luteus UH-Slu-Lm8-n1]